MENVTPLHQPEEFTINLVQASAGKRFGNYLIDLLVFYILMICWGVILAIASPESVENIDGDLDPLLDRVIALILYGIYMAFTEVMFKGKSLGKLITGTKAVNEDGSEITFATAMKRGLCRMVPFEAFSALGNPSYPWHDKWTNTIVIDQKQSDKMPEY